VKTPQEIATALSSGQETQQSNGSWMALCPVHDDHSPSFSISVKDGKLLVKCMAGCTQDAVIKALIARGLWEGSGTNDWKAMAFAPEGKAKPTGMIHPKFGVPSRRWEYRDERGRLVGYVYRFEKGDGKKELMPLSWCMSAEKGTSEWRWKGFKGPRPLYNAELLLKDKTKPILIVEGEKTADSASKILPDFLCMTWQGGAAAYKQTNWELLKGRDVTLWPDNDEPGVKAVTAIAEILHEAGAKAIRFVSLPDDLEEGWDLADSIPEGMDVQGILKSAKEMIPSGDPVMDELNKILSMSMLGNKATVIWEKLDPILKRVQPSFVSLHDVRTYYSNKMVPVGRRMVPVIDYWVTHPKRRSYQHVVFEPGRNDPGYYNLWKGFSYTPDPSGDWSMLDQHLHENIAQGDESLYNWMFGWFAQMFQHPSQKIGTSLAIRGKQGSGKTVVGEHVGQLIYDNYVLVDDPRYVIGQFNSHMVHALLLQADEGFFAGDPRIAGRLKGLITSPYNHIELKGKDSYQVNNYLRLLITSNSNWVVPAAFEERRFAILDCGDGRLQDNSYFAEMRKQLQNGGYEGLLHALLNFDLSNIDLQRVPQTAALKEQKEASQDPLTRFWIECVMEGEFRPNDGKWRTVIPCEMLYQSYVERVKTWGYSRRVSKNQFGSDLKRIVPGLDRGRATVDIMDEYGLMMPSRPWCYFIPELETCRRANGMELEPTEEYDEVGVDQAIPF
jgi:Family of unknown function (DUF5906)/Domain of unknown function (DUF6371)